MRAAPLCDSPAALCEDDMTIRRYNESDREVLKQISAVCFEGVSIDHNIERLCGQIAGKDWVRRKTIQIEDDINNYPDGIFVADIEQGPLVFVVDQVDAAADPPPGLVVQLDNMRKQWGRLKHFRRRGGRELGNGFRSSLGRAG